MAEQPIQQIVTQLRAGAEARDSGHFSIDLSRAAQQIDGLENRPGLYLLKLVQAAVAAGAGEIRIQLGRRQVKFEALGPLELSRDEVDLALADPFQPHSEAARHLAWAFFLARPVPHLRIEMSGGTYDSRHGWRDSAETSGLLLTFERDGGLLHWLAGLAAATQEHALLYERCAYAGIPIRMDGRLVNDPDRLDRWIARGNLQPPSVFQFVPDPYRLGEILVERNLLRRSGPAVAASLPTMRTVRRLRVGQEDFKLMDRTVEMNLGSSHVVAVHLCQWLHDGQPWPIIHLNSVDSQSYPLARAAAILGMSKILATPPEAVAPYLSAIPIHVHPIFSEPAQRYARNLPLVSMRLTLPLALNGPARLVLVHYGVALNPIVVADTCPGLIVVAAADHLKSDLSQLAVVEDEALKQLLREIQQHARQMTEDFLAIADQRYPDWVLKHFEARLGA